MYKRAKSVDMIPRDTPQTPQPSKEQPCSPLSTGSTGQENASPTLHQYYESLPDDMQTLKQQLAQAQLAATRLELELIKKEQGVDEHALSNRDKARIVNAMRSQFPLRLCLQVLGFSSSSYYFQHQRKTPFAKYEQLVHPIKSISRAIPLHVWVTSFMVRITPSRYYCQ